MEIISIMMGVHYCTLAPGYLDYHDIDTPQAVPISNSIGSAQLKCTISAPQVPMSIRMRSED